MKNKTKEEPLLLASLHMGGSLEMDAKRIMEGKKPLRGMYYGPWSELQKLAHGETDDISELKHVSKEQSDELKQLLSKLQSNKNKAEQ